MAVIYITESEAKTKWCPFSRVGFQGGASVNRHPMDYYPGRPSEGVVEDTRCIASGCMAWRVAEGVVPNGKAGPKHVADVSQGYCGLAQK